MNVAALLQPHMAIDAGARVPAAVLLVGVVHTHGHHIAPLCQIRRDIHRERGVAVVMMPRLVPIHIDIRTLIHAFEVKLRVGCHTFEHKTLAVPPRARSIPSAVVACRGLGVRRRSHAPVVGQLHSRPRPVVVIREGRIGSVGKHEAPAGIKQNTLSCRHAGAAADEGCEK